MCIKTSTVRHMNKNCSLRDNMVKIQRTLRSETLKSALKNFIVKPIVKNYFVISLRCLWDVDPKDVGKASFNILSKRDQIQKYLNESEAVVLYFSCLCAMESSYLRKKIASRKKKLQSHEEESESDEDDYLDDVLIPGISFWIAVNTTPSGSKQFETEITKKLLKAGMNVTSCKPITSRKSKHKTIDTLEYDSGALFQTLKDHNRKELIEEAIKFYNKQLAKAASKHHDVELPENVEFIGDEVTPVSLVLRPTIPGEMRDVILNAIDDIKFTKLEIDIIDESNDRAHSSPAKPKPSSTLCQAVDAINRLMKERGYALCDGMVYKKPDDAMFTYVKCCSVRDFLMRSLANPEIADLLAHQIDKVSGMLSDPSCGLIKPIKRLHNVIECLPPRTCFLIAEKKFVRMKRFIGSATPRAFVRYEYNKNVVPYPRPFVQGIFNSFPDPLVRVNFLQKYYQLLLHGLFPIKEPKLLLEGPSNSGKTSWFYCFEGIISTRNIAGVTQEGKFAGHMIDASTELVFMDEWTSNSLSCEDAKRVLQGGLIMLSQKHRDAKKVNYKSGFFITTNVLPDFGIELDQAAVYERLKVFSCSQLPKKDTSVSSWLRNNCMSVFHYCSEVLKDTPLFETCTDEQALRRTRYNEGAVYNDFDGEAGDLVHDSDFEEKQFFDSGNTSSDFEEEPSFSQEEIDSYFLAADDCDVTRWQKDHPLFTTDEKKHKNIVSKLCSLSEEEWKKLPINKNDIKRYHIRKTNNWDGTDSFYAAWLERLTGGQSSSNFEDSCPPCELSKRKVVETADNAGDSEDDVDFLPPAFKRPKTFETDTADDKRDIVKFHALNTTEDIITISSSSSDEVDKVFLHKKLFVVKKTVPSENPIVIDSDE